MSAYFPLVHLISSQPNAKTAFWILHHKKLVDFSSFQSSASTKYIFKNSALTFVSANFSVEL